MSSYEERLAYDKNFSFVWVFMSRVSKAGSLGAPSAIFSEEKVAKEWVMSTGLPGMLYRIPIDRSLAEYADGFWGGLSDFSITSNKETESFKAGIDFLGCIEHEHFN